MNRREILKFSLLAPFLGLFKKKESQTIESVPVRFWMQTYGPHYDPSSFGFDWKRADSPLLGIYHGEELLSNKASDYPIGTGMILEDGARYICYGAMEGIHLKGKGVFLNEPPRDT